jgi:hypothetical protein
MNEADAQKRDLETRRHFVPDYRQEPLCLLGAGFLAAIDYRSKPPTMFDQT